MPQVLVVDDQAHVRAAVTIALRANGFDVAQFDNGRTGLLAAEHSKFDVALIDIFMPNMDGVKLIRSLRERCTDLPIIAMSGKFFQPSGRTVLDILPTASDLSRVIALQKPFRANELVRAVQAALDVATLGRSER